MVLTFFKILSAPDPCVNSPGMDVAFLLDRTKSLTIADFMLAKGFLGELVSALDISPEATHAAVILFAKEGKVLNTFREEKYYNREALVELIEKIPDKRFMPTRTDRALLAANDLFTEEGGDRGKAPNVVILFTDGKTNPRSQPFSEIVPILKVSVYIYFAHFISKPCFNAIHASWRLYCLTRKIRYSFSAM